MLLLVQSGYSDSPAWLTISEDALRTDPRGAPISDDPAVADLVDKESSGVDHDMGFPPRSLKAQRPRCVSGSRPSSAE